jgi:hypothetical protein
MRQRALQQPVESKVNMVRASETRTRKKNRQIASNTRRTGRRDIDDREGRSNSPAASATRQSARFHVESTDPI